MEEITYQNCDAYIDSYSLSEKIALILKLADGEDNRLYCHAKVKIIMDYEYKADINAINEILLASFKIKRTSAKVLMLRGTYSVRRYLKYWHNLRDHVHTEILNSEESHLRMNGLFEEVRNSVDNLWWQLTPHKSYMFGFPMDKFWPEIQWRYYNVNKERENKKAGNNQ